MIITQIETNITNLLKNFTQDDFIFDFLVAYGEPKATLTRLQKSDLNQLESKGEVLLRKKVFFKEVHEHLHGTIDTLKNEFAHVKQKPRFIIVTDYKTLLAYDTKTTNTLDIDFNEVVKHYDFFLPLAGMEKSTHVDENPADVKASNKLAKLYDEILKENPTSTHAEVHALNVFLTRLLFCYFAEDSNIFEDNIFTDSIASHTQVDGSDVDSYLERLFDVFNTDEKDRDSSLPQYLKVFSYVNGGLFRDKYPVPKFTTKSRNILIEIGELDWSEINPDIFGSMIQAVVTPEHRGDMGMHYTSVPNIMKVMQPLFLDELYEEFEKAKGNTKKLNLLHLRLQNLKIFDPACGSGNFLIIAYKELRKLEMLIFKEGGLLISPSIKLTQFYGIELDDFAHEVAILSLWLAEHQMNVAFKKEFGTVPPALPLKDGGNIVHGNATRIDWESVCPKEDGDEIYVLGNPPYLGSSLQNKEQKNDMESLFESTFENYKNLDYIACWFYKGALYIKNLNAKYAFVSTNSITQGEQVYLLWPKTLFKNNLEIVFAYQSFKWKNNAKSNAGVTVVIIGVQNKSTNNKYIFKETIKHCVSRINPYLIEGNDIVVGRTPKSINNFPELVRGSMPTDDGNFVLTENEKNELLNKFPNATKFIKPFMSGGDFLKDIKRWCLWIKDKDVKEAEKNEFIKNRLNAVYNFRLSSKAPTTRDYAKYYNRFRQMAFKESSCIILPLTSSEKRRYIPFGFLSEPTVVTNSAGVIYDAEAWIFGVITSYMHNIWVKTVGGALESRIRYSSVLCYNTFPFPNINQKQKEDITELVFNILDEREQHSEKTLAQLYDPDKMPADLKEAHHQLDLAIERCYRKKPFQSDEERLEYLFKLYEEMIEAEGK
ncbi:N-6 DNA methylase [Sulfurimonas sp. SWIR-19]|uniref:DNA methyltransferase n=1 Tax=Sulfurimonas sp. SWIR-19 TaxID=2878390 RepID=UPI001CF44FC9|nr:DNA methyltransferase [Sulfurimonas sp. SWIR-19]UCN00511.1 N-6 DNA methylase [Sulfurimonas sp. SWIR-19]